MDFTKPMMAWYFLLAGRKDNFASGGTAGMYSGGSGRQEKPE